MHRSKLAAMVVVFALMSGCGTTTPTRGSDAFVDRPPASGHGVVYIGRPDGKEVSLVPLQLEIDGRSLVGLGVNEYTRVELPPGRYRFAAADVYLTWIWFGTPVPLEFQVQEGVRYFLTPVSREGHYQSGVGAKRYGSFSFSDARDGQPAPRQFNGLTYVKAL
jgi:hypothetical protein